MTTSVPINSAARYGEAVLDSLVDDGPGTADEIAARLEWPRSRVLSAIKYARERICPEMGISIPAPTPATGWVYEATTDWHLVEQGAGYVLGTIEGRLRSIQRDVEIVKPHLERGTIEWRRAAFLDKHLGHLVRTLGEINGSR